VAEVGLPLRIVAKAPHRVRVVVDSRARRNAKGHDPEQIAGLRVERAGQDAALILENMPDADARRGWLALVSLRLRLQRHWDKRRQKQKDPSEKHLFILFAISLSHAQGCQHINPGSGVS
jgi:predicted nucleic acid-binding Zn ribbon protein